MAGNYTVIKRFSDNYYSVTQLKHKKSERLKVNVPTAFVFPEKYLNQFDLPMLPDIDSLRESQQIKKLHVSLVRSRTKIFEISMCNDWELFATFTIDPKKYDRYNLPLFFKDFSNYISNLNRNYNFNIKYLFIPEMHKDGAWHLHGLISGLPLDRLLLFKYNSKLPKYIRDKLLDGFDVYDWPSYRGKFGFCDLEKIRNKESCCKYIVKYITKDLGRSVSQSHAKVYYCSQGLNRPTVIYEGEDSEQIALPSFSNVWIERKDFFTFAEAFEYSSIQYFDSFINSGLDDSTIQRILSD